MNTQQTGLSIFQGNPEQKHLVGFSYTSRSLPHMSALLADNTRQRLQRDYELLPGTTPLIQTYTLVGAGTNDDKYLVIMDHDGQRYAFFIQDELGYQAFMSEYAPAYSALPAIMNPFWSGNTAVSLIFPS